MGKHAYLIIAHNQFALLTKLLKCLDDERNDIYIHVDKKVKTDLGFIEGICSKSRVKLVKRIKVAWGGRV